MDIVQYIQEYLNRGGTIQAIPRGQFALNNNSVPVYWLEDELIYENQSMGMASITSHSLGTLD